MKNIFSKLIIFTSLLLVAVCTACSFEVTHDDESVEWNYTKSEAASFIELDHNIKMDDDNLVVIKLTASEDIFAELDSKYILLFNVDELGDVRGIITYDDVRYHLIKYQSVNKIDDKNIEIKLNGDLATHYGVLIHKNVLSVDNYAVACIPALMEASSKIITEYEEEIIKQKGKWNDAATAIQVANYISQIVLGFMGDQPIAFAGGLFGLASTLGGAFFSGGPSLDSISKQLDIIDAKIDALNIQIDANQKQLLDEIVRVQAMIDEVKINQYNQNITAYQTDYVKPLDDFLLIYKDMVEQAFKEYVNKEEAVKLYYGASDYSTNDLLFVEEQNVDGATSFTYNISDFSNAKAYLASNRNIVGDGFPAALYKDIKNALKNETLPTGRSLDVVAEDVYKTLCTSLNQQVLAQKNETLHRDVLQFLSNFVSFAKAIAGINFDSVVNSYISRVECIYNFASETKDLIRQLLASFKNRLNYYLCIAQTACLAQEINYTRELGEAYNVASYYISSYYDNQMNIDNKYCYPLKTKIDCKLYNAICSTYFTNLGNHPTLHADFNLTTDLSFDYNKISGTNVDINSIRMLDYPAMRSIITRYNLLRAAGTTKDSRLIDYLNHVGIVTNKDLDTLNSLFNSGRTLDRHGTFLTSYAIRDLDNSDSSLKMTCNSCGNPDGYYFNVGQYYNYRYSDFNAESKYWSGKVAYGDKLDPYTGEIISNKTICAYARYSESHTLWIDDEHWAFIDDVFGSFIFILNKK